MVLLAFRMRWKLTVVAPEPETEGVGPQATWNRGLKYMSVTSALKTGISGLTSNGEAMNVIGNNIANVNTVGFKAGRTLFSDLLPSAVGKESQEGTGVQLQAVQNIYTQGTSQNSANVTDLTIEGDTFFALQSPDAPATAQSNAFLSRAGAFKVDADLTLVNADGYQVLDTSGKPIVFVNSGTSPSTDFGKITNIDENGVITYLATDGITHNYYNTSKGVPGVDIADKVYAAVNSAAAAAADLAAASGTLLAAATTANNDAVLAATSGFPPGSDALRNATAAASLVAARGAFAGYLTAADSAKTAADNAAVTAANATGTSQDPRLLTVSLAINAAHAQVGLLGGAGVGGEPAITGITASSSAADYLAAATAANTDISSPGTGMTALFADATSAAAIAMTTPTAGRAVNPVNLATVQRIALVQIANPGALMKVGSSLFKANADCGVSTAAFSLSANSANGTSESIRSNSLEASNVDLSTEFVNMITTQRAYSANSKTITTADAMIQEVLGLIR